MATRSHAMCCLGRARGDADADSNYDVAVFPRGMADQWGEMHRLAEIETGILYDTGARCTRCRIATDFGENGRR